jgi:GTP-binding protein Era
MDAQGGDKAGGFRAGFCAIVGRPNVGKSTLMNRLLGQKLAVVTPKPQTTRNRILGVKNRPDAQVVYLDTPGIHKARSSLNKYMVEQALGAAAECDVVLLLVEAPRLGAEALQAGFDPGEGNRAIVERLAEIRRPRVLAVNKVDLVAEKQALLPLIEVYSRLATWDEIVPISARDGDGVEALEAAVVARLPVGPALYPEEMITDRAERFLAAELVREQAYLLLAEELPYSVAVTIDKFDERADKKDVVIDAVIHVERDSQKRIVVGEGGRMVKEIGTRARGEIAKLLGVPTHLKLFVRVDANWTQTQKTLRRLGYE